MTFDQPERQRRISPSTFAGTANTGAKKTVAVVNGSAFQAGKEELSEMELRPASSLPAGPPPPPEQV